MLKKTTQALLWSILLVSSSSNAMKMKNVVNTMLKAKKNLVVQHIPLTISMNEFKKIDFENNTPTLEQLIKLSNISKSNLVELEKNEVSYDESKDSVNLIVKLIKPKYKGLSENINLIKNQKRHGPLGATIGAYIGKAAVYIVGHGAIQVVGVLSGPAYWVTVPALEAWCAAPIEAASMAAAVAGGIIGGAGTPL